MKTSTEIRSDFLEFFKSKGHAIVPSAPIIPQNDPTLLFTNAGMNQFKDVFLGAGTRPYKRAADTQKCLRVSGKHNDLEVVGRDTYHHTMFEMLGNWSFGDYFKKDAIHWAWELLTGVWQIPKEKLWATVFGGDQKEGLAADEEAAEIWKQETDIGHDRILRFSKKENFWEMGDTGPCGPCTEIHMDRGPEACDKQNVPGHTCSVNGSCARFIEIWNLVFIQFNRQADQTLTPLPNKHVDTGMGFERLVSVLQGKRSNYDTDVFTPILAEIAKLTNITYTAGNSASDVAFRVIADHIRALCCAFADGALPGNAGRGYVLRRLLRRAARFGRQSLNMQDPFIHRLVPTVAQIFGEIFPEIKQRQEHIALLIKSEEESFAQMLTRGIHLFNELVEEVKKEGKTAIPGERAYRLYHQDGFPKDLVELMADEQNLSIDEEGWKKAEEEHIERSRGKEGAYEIEPSHLEGLAATRFMGYATLECTANIVKFIDNTKLILDRTPFYAEGGGQVGDTGMITGRAFRFKVTDTKKMGDIYIHFGEVLEQNLAQMPRRITAYVDKERRRKIMANHTATHLLHWALRQVLGDHVAQQGSVVEPDRLRFDISHPKKIEDAELLAVEKLVNERIYENIRVRKNIETLEVAKKKGAIALFGEKYGDRVRVVQIGRYSKELCGGTHTYFTGDLGSFRIVSESSIQAGVRRIEAATRDKAVELGQSISATLKEIQNQLKTDSASLLAKIISLQEEVKELKKKGTQQAQKDSKTFADQILEKALMVQETKVVVTRTESMAMNDLRALADLFKKSAFRAAGLLVSVLQEKALLVAFVSDKELEKREVLHAGEIMKVALGILGGGGDTRRKEFAQGQGSNIHEIENMLPKVSSFIQEKILLNQ